MEERYHATTQNRFYPDMSNVNQSITVEAKLISPPMYLDSTDYEAWEVYYVSTAMYFECFTLHFAAGVCRRRSKNLEKTPSECHLVQYNTNPDARSTVVMPVATGTLICWGRTSAVEVRSVNTSRRAMERERGGGSFIRSLSVRHGVKTILISSSISIFDVTVLVLATDV